MATSALYFSALTTSAKNFAGHRGLSIAVPVAAFGLSSFWEALVAGSPLFGRTVQARGGDVVRELDVVRLFKFFAILLGVVGVIGALGLIVIPSHLPKRVEGEEPTEEDALLPRAEESESSSVISAVSAREELTAEHRPFLRDRSTYLFGMALMILLGSGEMFINCVSNLFLHRLIAVGDNVADCTREQRFHAIARSKSSYFNVCLVQYGVPSCGGPDIGLHVLASSNATNITNSLTPGNFSLPGLRIVYACVLSNLLAPGMVLCRQRLGWFQLRRNIYTCTDCCQCCLGNRWLWTKLGRPYLDSGYISTAFGQLMIALGAVIFGLLYARVYDVHSPPPPAICEGRECWQDTIVAAGWAGFVATMLLGLTWWSWRKRGWTV